MNILQQLENSIISADKLQADGVNSASIAVLEDGQISRRVITKGSENTETVYQACSISKPITALAVARLVDEHRLSYDTKVIDRLPDSVIANITDKKTAHLMEYVTVGMLLSHTSGLSQHGFIGYANEPPSAGKCLSGKHPSNSLKVHFKSFPGATFSYSGGGYTVLQIFLENLLEKPFADIMHEVVLKPLSMTRSWYSDLPSNEMNYAKAHYTGYTATRAEYHHFPELAAAGLWTTPTDLLKAIAAVQESLYTESGFLKQDTAKKMLTEVGRMGSGSIMTYGWGLNDAIFAHAGSSDPGYECYVFGFHGGYANTKDTGDRSERRDGIAIMTNSQEGLERAIRQMISATFFQKGWERINARLPYGGESDFVPYAAPAGTDVDSAWKNWKGKWDSDWELLDRDGPAWNYKSFPLMRLVPAAAPCVARPNGDKEVILVVDGLDIGVRLTWEEDTRVIKLLGDDAKTFNQT